MNSRPSDLPDFKTPPVVEVALSIQFATLEQFKSVYAGWLWQKFQNEFPLSEEQPPLPPTFETFGLPTTPVQNQIQFLNSPPFPRYWFKDRHDTQLIQVQQDRFIHNWKKQGPEHSYPRYENIRKRFREEVDVLTEFLAENRLGTIKPNQCEVTYINHIPLTSLSGTTLNLSDLLTLWSEKYSDKYLAVTEDALLQFRYELKDKSGNPYGRLYARCETATRNTDRQPIVALTLIARGKPSVETIDSAFDFLDQGREAIVRGFASMTTKTAHAMWERTDGNA